MSKLQVLPEETLTLQVLGEIVKSGQPVILPRQLTANGVYSAKQEGASGYDPVTVAVDMTPAYNEGYNKGVAEYQWVQYGQSLFSMFENVTFPENTELTLKMPNFLNRFDSGFRAAKNLKKVTLVCENWNGYAYGVTASQAFATMTSGLEVVDLSKFKVIYSNVNIMFSNNYSMREIIGELDFSLSTNNSNFLPGCSALEEIRFVAGCLKVGTNFSPCSKLSNDSIRSILDGLADLTGTATQTVTFHKEVGEKLTDVQKAAATAKNWTLVY